MSGRLRYIIDVYSSGVQATSGSIAFSLKTSQLAEAPSLGGQLVRASENRVESQPWKARILDTNSTFTSRIANSSGRMNLLGRLVRFRSSLDSTGTFQTLTVGRLSDIQLGKDVVTWDVTIQDERFLERDLQIFSQSNTSIVLPRGTVSGFMNTSTPVDLAQLRWFDAAQLGNLVGIAWGNASGVGGTAGGPGALVAGQSFLPQVMIDDVKPNPIAPNSAMTVGNFQTLRFHNTGNGTDYEVASVIAANSLTTGTALSVGPIDYLLRLNQGAGVPLALLLVWPTSQPGVGAFVSGYLYMPGHISSPDIPLHIGGLTGLHPGRVARNCYNGIYNPPGSTSIKLRISTAAFDSWEKDPSYGRVWFRITAPQSMASFLDQRIFGPYGMWPLINSSGKITPVRAWPPSSSGVPAITPTITSTNAVTHPTWEQPSREAVTALRLRYEYYGFQLDRDGKRTYSQSADGLVTLQHESTRLADSVSRLGRQELSWTYGAIFGAGQLPVPNFRWNSSQLLPNAGYGETQTSVLAKHIFARFADGPLYVSVNCHRSIDATTHGTVNPGDYVKLNLGTWPNPLTRTRGGFRLLQVVGRGDTPAGPTFRLLDYGPSTANPLAVPGIALAAATNGDSSRHSFKITVSGVAAGASWMAMVGMTTSTGGATPASSSPVWKWAGAGTTGALSVTLGQRPSNTKHFARARAMKTQRILSAWSTAPSRITAKIAGPSGLATTGQTKGTVGIKWTNGSSLYASEIMVDTSTASALGTSDRVANVPPATTRDVLTGLPLTGKVKIGVRHNDPWGGFSTMTTVVTASASSLLPWTSQTVPRGFHILPGIL